MSAGTDKDDCTGRNEQKGYLYKWGERKEIIEKGKERKGGGGGTKKTKTKNKTATKTESKNERLKKKNKKERNEKNLVCLLPGCLKLQQRASKDYSSGGSALVIVSAATRRQTLSSNLR